MLMLLLFVKLTYNFLQIMEKLDKLEYGIELLDERIEMLENEILVAKLDLGVFAVKIAVQESIYN